MHKQTLDLEGLYQIGDAVELSIILYDDNETIVFRHYLADLIGFFNIPPIPVDTMGARIRVVQLGDDRIISLSEVVAIDRWSCP